MFGIDDIAISSAFGAANLVGNLYATDVNSNMMRTNLDFQAQQSGSVYQRGVRDLEAAGLNPMLAYTKGDPAAGGAGFAGAINPMQGTEKGVETALAMRTNSAQVANLEANSEKAKAEAAESLARAKTYDPSIQLTLAQTQLTQANIGKVAQDIQESIAKMSNLAAQTTREYASASNIVQQTTNLREQVPQIRATVNQLQSIARLNDAQVQEVFSKTALNATQIEELRQKIQAALPSLQRNLMELERQSQQLAMPGKEQQAGVQSTAAGYIGAMLRELLPFNSIFANISRR